MLITSKVHPLLLFGCSIIFILIFAFSCSKKVPSKTTQTVKEPKSNPPKQTEDTPKKDKNNLPKADLKLKESTKVLKVADQIQYLKINSTWVDSVFRLLTPDERIAQLIMFDAYSYKNKAHLDTLLKLVKDYKIGGFIFMKGSPVKQVKMINALQSVSKVPLLISMDAEYGIGMRLDSANKYPFQMTLGAIQNKKLIYEMGQAIASDVKRVGMHINFAPVLDINNNPKNPVIGIRSFGENKYEVTSKSLEYMKGLQDNKVIATAKHFPGHGDTDTDSHHDLPLITASKERLDTLELYPFRELIREGLGGIMVAHMNIPALDNTKNLPSTLSKPIITDLLKEKLGFKGIIFTDAMVMEGLAKYYPSGTAEPMAIISGNDILEKMKNAKVAIKSIKEAVANGKISQEEIDDRCKKVLAAKEWVGLNNYKPISLTNIYKDLKNPKSDTLISNLIRASATLLSNKENTLPLDNNKSAKIATLSLNANGLTSFQKNIDQKVKSDHFFLPLKSTTTAINKVKKSLEDYDIVILGIYDSRSWPMYKLNYTPQMNALINDIIKSEKSIISLFGSAYALSQFDNLNQAKAILVMYELSEYTQEVATEVLTGKIKTKGKLPVTINTEFPYGYGM